jgi:hypothetical protein
MPYLLIQQSIENYEQWRSVFDEQRDVRKSAGALRSQVLRDAGEPEKLTVLVEFDTLENAQRYAQRPQLPEIMRSAGIIERTKTEFLTEE